ncbi:hypothetical protein [Phenylobacterium sp.]|uniref:hypothetical protein n=1 Tax=Phenylobacterium sp. TaxID=1871053 RepID=UPI0030F46D1D
MRTDLPSDQIEDEHDIVQFGGRGVAEAIGGLLAAQGYEVSQPEYAGEHGWEFDFHALERRFWCQVTETDRIQLLCIDMTSSPFGGVSRKPPHPAYVEVLTLLDRELAADPRFYDLAWYFDDEVARDLPGSLSPVCESVAAQVGSWVEFRADLFEEIGERQADDMGLGRGCADAVVGLLSSLGHQVWSPLPTTDNGWRFSFGPSGPRFTCDIHEIGETYRVLVEDKGRTFVDKLFKRPPTALHGETLSRLNAALTDDPRFRDIAWWAPNKGRRPDEEKTIQSTIR